MSILWKDYVMSNNVILRHGNNYRSINLNDLDSSQINNVISYVTRQCNKIYYRIYHSLPIPLPAMARLQQRLSQLLGNLDMITNYKACLN